MMRAEGRANQILIWTMTIFGLVAIYAPPLYLLGCPSIRRSSPACQTCRI